MSFSVFSTITPGFSFRPTSPFLAELAVEALRRLESPLTAHAAARPIQPLSLGESGALIVEAALLQPAAHQRPRAAEVPVAFAAARAALAGPTSPTPLTLS